VFDLVEKKSPTEKRKWHRFRLRGCSIFVGDYLQTMSGLFYCVDAVAYLPRLNSQDISCTRCDAPSNVDHEARVFKLRSWRLPT
jgi:hypothetical protein